MLENVKRREDLLGFARKQAKAYDRKTIRPEELSKAVDEGWSVQRKNKASFSVVRNRPRRALLESRVWTILYRMGFNFLSGPGGARLVGARKGQEDAFEEIDIIAIDDEIALAIKCKAFSKPKRDEGFWKEIDWHASIKRRFAINVQKQFPASGQRHVASIIITWDLVLTESDRHRAVDQRVFLLDERDLEYFEALVKHLGIAAKYQLLAEIFRGKKIRGLEICVPALRTPMGSLNCYTFAVRPDYLLKIAYVAHRAKGKPFDIDAYQRLLSRTRLRKIAEFIAKDGIFPTNIVINVERTLYLRFDRGKQEGDGTGGLFGWLTLSPTYGSAWIIDGQHRLYAYSGHPRASTSFLNVLAFEALSPPVQTQLFVDINSEQRRVKRSLLVELDATLKWESEDEQKRIHAIISKAGMALDQEAGSPLRDRVLLADARRTTRRCISLTSIATALNKPGFFVISRKRGITQYGPLWRDEPTDSLRRTVTVLV